VKDDLEKAEPEYQYTYDGDHSYYDDDLPEAESLISIVSNTMSTFVKSIVIVCIIYVIVEWWLG